jgi:hypothetical protein
MCSSRELERRLDLILPDEITYEAIEMLREAHKHLHEPNPLLMFQNFDSPESLINSIITSQQPPYELAIDKVRRAMELAYNLTEGTKNTKVTTIAGMLVETHNPTEEIHQHPF